MKYLNLLIIVGLLISLLQSYSVVQAQNTCTSYQFGTTNGQPPPGFQIGIGQNVSGVGLKSQFIGSYASVSVVATNFNVVYSIGYRIVNPANMVPTQKWLFSTENPSFQSYFNNLTASFNFMTNNDFAQRPLGNLVIRIETFPNDGKLHDDQSFILESIEICGKTGTPPTATPNPSATATPTVPGLTPIIETPGALFTLTPTVEGVPSPTDVPQFGVICDEQFISHTGTNFNTVWDKHYNFSDCGANQPNSQKRVRLWVSTLRQDNYNAITCLWNELQILVSGGEVGKWYKDGNCTGTYINERIFEPDETGFTVSYSAFSDYAMVLKVTVEVQVIGVVLPTSTSTATVTPSCTSGCFATPEPTLPWMATLLPTIQATKLPRPINLPTRIPTLSIPRLQLPGLSIPTPNRINTPSAIPTPSLSLPTPNNFASTPQRITVTPPTLSTPQFSYQFSATVTVVALSTLASKQFTLSLVMSTTIYTIDMQATAVTGSAIVSSSAELINSVSYATKFISGVLSLTQRLSQSTLGSPTATIVMQTAPGDYIPVVPRELANVGYTFEQMAAGDNSAYGPLAYARFFGEISTMPFSLLLMMKNILAMLGPLGLFIAWIIVMTPFVSIVKTIVFVKSLLINMFNLFLRLIDYLSQIFQMFFLLLDLLTNPVFLVLMLVGLLVTIVLSCGGLSFILI